MHRAFILAVLTLSLHLAGCAAAANDPGPDSFPVGATARSRSVDAWQEPRREEVPPTASAVRRSLVLSSVAAGERGAPLARHPSADGDWPGLLSAQGAIGWDELLRCLPCAAEHYTAVVADESSNVSAN